MRTFLNDLFSLLVAECYLFVFSPVFCWWTAWPFTGTAVPSASRWRRNWSNSPETSTVLFRCGKHFWKLFCTHSCCQHLEHTARVVWKTQVKGGRRKTHTSIRSSVVPGAGVRLFLKWWLIVCFCLPAEEVEGNEITNVVWGHIVSWWRRQPGNSLLSFLQSSQSGSGVTDSCEGAQLYPATPPIMLQVNCCCTLHVFSRSVLKHEAQKDTIALYQKL